MALKVIGISSSPRVEGNSDLLLRQVLSGAEAEGLQTEYIALRELEIAPCAECNTCLETGKCTIEDDCQMLYKKIIEADRLVFATPVFFMGVCAQGKGFIDRCQCFWAGKYVVKKPPEYSSRNRRGITIAVAGSKSKNMFNCIALTMKYFYDAIEMDCIANLFVNQVDCKDSILKHPSAMKEAFALGRRLADITATVPEKPVNIELFSQ